MNQSELVSAISAQTGATKTATAAMLDSLIHHINQAIAKGDSVRLHNLGTFTTRSCAARQGRNPSTGEPITIPGARVIAFKPAQELRDSAATSEF